MKLMLKNSIDRIKWVPGMEIEGEWEVKKVFLEETLDNTAWLVWGGDRKKVTQDDIDDLEYILNCNIYELNFYLIREKEKLSCRLRDMDTYGEISPDQELMIKIKKEYEPDCGWYSFFHEGCIHAIKIN